MGWLRDLMDRAEPPVPSFGKLAAACLEHSEWPHDAELKPRSLSTLFSKLDREVDLDWLRDRPEVQLVLARSLGRPLGELQLALGDGDAASHGRILRLTSARFARELDLSQEPLPPGLPLAAFTPPLWEPSLWRAPPGSGRTLVGLWLRARGLAHFATVRERADWQELPARGALFIEVARQFTPSLEDLKGLAGERRPVCLALERPPAGHQFREFSSEAPRVYLNELIDWLGARLDDSGHFQPERAEQWMRRMLPHGAIRTFGDTLGLLGMLDETPTRNLTGSGTEDLNEAYVRRRVRDASLDTSWGPRIAESAYEALRRVATRCLITPGAQLDQPRSLAEWTELLADGEELSPDEEWFTRALLGGSTLAQRELRRAARKLPPSGYQLARTLSLAGILQKTAGQEAVELSVLSPRVLVSVLEARAYDDALSLSPRDWGQALLDDERRPAIEAALSARLQAGNPDALELLLDDFDEPDAQPDPALVAALDAGLRALSRAELKDANPSEELVHRLLEHVAENVVSWEDELRPSLTLAPLSTWQAAFCVLTRNHRFPIASLDPHRAASRGLRARVAWSCSTEARATGDAAYLHLANELTPRGAPERPALLLSCDLLTARASNDLAEGISPDCANLILTYAVEVAGPLAYQNFFRFVPAEGSSRLGLSSETETQLWRHCPESILLDRHRQGQALRWDLLLPHQFSPLLSCEVPLGAPAVRACPIASLVHAFEERGPSFVTQDGLGVLLARAARELARPLVASLSWLPLPEAESLLAKVPPEAALTISTALPPTAELLLWPPERLLPVQRFLSNCVLSRVPGYQQCFVQQEQLRRALRPLLR